MCLTCFGLDRRLFVVWMLGDRLKLEFSFWCVGIRDLIPLDASVCIELFSFQYDIV